MHKLEKPYKVICKDVTFNFKIDSLTLGKVYEVIGDDANSIDPFDMCDYVVNDYGRVCGYDPWRFERIK